MELVEEKVFTKQLQGSNENRSLEKSYSAVEAYARDTENRIALLKEWGAYLDTASELKALEDEDKLLSVYVEGSGRVYPGF